jgi:hypothetical protein
MTRWLRNHKEARISAAAIEDLMRRLRCNGDALAGLEEAFFATLFDGELTGEYVEELRGALVEVVLFGGAGRHALFDHAEIFGAMEMPAIARLRAAGAGPGVVLGIVVTDNPHCGLS